MPIKSLLTFLLFLCYSFVFLSDAKSQQVFDVAYRFEQDTLLIKGGQTFSNKISIINRTDKQIELIPSAYQSLALAGLIRLPQAIVLQANETRSFPLKYMADRQTIISNNQPFTVGFSALDKNISIPAPISFYTRLNSERTLLLQSEQPEYYLDQTTNQVQVMVQATNIGLVPITFQLLFSGYPAGFEISGESMSVTLQPGVQTLLPFTARMRSKNTAVDFNVMLQAVDNLGKTFSTNNIRFMSIGHIKRFDSGGFSPYEPYGNAVAFRYMNMGKGTDIYQLQSNGQFDFTETRKMNYRLNVDYYKKQDAINSYDTFIEYQDKDWGIKVGNIYENLDRNISGRGIKASYKLDADRTISVYGVDNNYLLISQMNHHIPGAKIIGANYLFRAKSGQESNLSYLYGKDNYRGVNSNQISGKTYWSISPDEQVVFEGGYSLEHVGNGKSKHALAVGVNYNYQFGPYQLSSMNYYSSPFYTGLRRGLIQSDSRISRAFGDSKSMAARMSFMGNDARYQQQDKGYYFTNPNNIQIYELGYHTAFGKFQIDFKPYFMGQQLQYQGFDLLGDMALNLESKAIRTIGDISFFSSIHRFSIRTDYGYTYHNTSNRPLAPFHSLRLTGNYSNPFLGFSTYVQVNPYYLSDLMMRNATDRYRVYSFGPNTQFKAFQDRLQVQLMGMYSYYEASHSNNISVNSNVKWRLMGNWNLSADLYYTLNQSRSLIDFPLEGSLSQSYSFDSRQIRVGVERKFSKLGNGIGHKLNLQFFDDVNNNGMLDVGEISLDGIVVKIDNHVALTDSKGRVKFLDMTPGSYTVHLENNQGWLAQGPIQIVLTKNQTQAIPLVKTKILKGQIKSVVNKYANTNPELSGIRINAVDALGNEYKTLSDFEGNYTFFLPLGSYTVFISTAGMSFSIDNPSRKIEVNKDQNIYLQDFEYRDERRKIGIKRF
ncbi:collagen binding domain-containing protein [Sphingobacterium sp. SG20118]|uniref:MSCRAMM family protein n=1 Tax=Sphingobacterium sp. SG20118 TaxID=3367156 RepID=UPI0037DFC19D